MAADGVWNSVLKIKPPLVFSTVDADKMISGLRDALQELEEVVHIVDAVDDELIDSVRPGQDLARAYFKYVTATYGTNGGLGNVCT
jgi:hypothetical protein